MLELYYDFLPGNFDRHDFELIQMDRDSNYIAIFADRLHDIVRPELRAGIEEKKQQWLGRMPGLSKHEFEGSKMIALCSKCYYVDGQESEKEKFSIKGSVSKRRLTAVLVEQKIEDFVW